MIRTFCLLILLVCAGQLFSVYGQESPGEYLIKNVYIDLDADTRYVRKLANRTISMYWQKKKSNSEEIECFRSELMKSGLFENFKTKLDKSEDSDKYNLLIIVNYQSKNPTYRIGDIKLVGFDDIDSAKFNSNLIKYKLDEKILALKTDFPMLEKEINQAIQESYVGKTLKEELGLPWIEIQLNTNGELDVLVMPNFRDCSVISK